VFSERIPRELAIFIYETIDCLNTFFRNEILMCKDEQIEEKEFFDKMYKIIQIEKLYIIQLWDPSFINQFIDN